jgi:hypothetical protein
MRVVCTDVFPWIVVVAGALGKIALNSIRRPKQSIVVNANPMPTLSSVKEIQ